MLSALKQQSLTMTTRQIAELTGKQHGHVIRDTEVMLSELGLSVVGYVQIWTHPQNGQQYRELALPKDLTLTLVSGYSVPMRKRIIDRWQELEDRTAPLDPMRVLSDPAAMRSLLLSYTERVLELQDQVAAQAPKVAAMERITAAEGSVCITDAAKALGMRPRALFDWLHSHGWIYRRGRCGEWVPYQPRIEQGVMEMKVRVVTRTDGTERVAERAMVTPRGIARLAELMNKSLTGCKE